MQKYKSLPIAFLFVLLLPAYLVAQEGISVKYVFSRAQLDHLLVQRTEQVPDTLGYVLPDSATGRPLALIGKNTRGVVHYERFAFIDSAGQLQPTPRRMYGTLQQKKGDTLFITLWHFEHDTKMDRLFPGIADHLYALAIQPWQRDSSISSWRHTKSRYRGMYALPKWYPVKFKHLYLGATTVPFRVKVWDGSVDKDFLNANVSFGYLWGKTRFYKYADIRPRNFSFGLGAFLGLVEINDSISNKERLGFSWGMNLMANVYNNLSILIALGANTNFGTKYNKEASNPDGSINWKGFIQPYIGIGFGYGLYSVYQIGAQR